MCLFINPANMWLMTIQQNSHHLKVDIKHWIYIHTYIPIFLNQLQKAYIHLSIPIYKGDIIFWCSLYFLLTLPLPHLQITNKKKMNGANWNLQTASLQLQNQNMLLLFSYFFLLIKLNQVWKNHITFSLPKLSLFTKH